MTDITKFIWEALEDPLHAGEKYVRVLGYSDTGVRCLAIPAAINGMTVKQIGSRAFSACVSLRKITVPECVETLGTNVFAGCAARSAGPTGSGCDIKYGWKTKIPDRAFSGCRKLARVLFAPGITEIGAYSFYGCESLDELRLPGTLEKIGFCAFSYCDSVASVEFPLSVVSVGRFAFANPTARGLASIVEEGVQDDGTYELIDEARVEYGEARGRACQICGIIKTVFTGGILPEELITRAGVRSLPLSAGTDVYLNDAQYHISVRLPAKTTVPDEKYTDWISSAGPYGSGSDIEFGWTDEIPDSFFYNAQSLETARLPDTLKRIGAYAFAGCVELRQVELPDGLECIGDHAFEDCLELRNIRLPGNLRRVGEFAFHHCKYITDATFPDGMEEIGICAFMNCESVTEAYIPASVTALGGSALQGTLALKKLTCLCGNPDAAINFEMLKRLEYCNVPHYSFSGLSRDRKKKMISFWPGRVSPDLFILGTAEGFERMVMEYLSGFSVLSKELTELCLSNPDYMAMFERANPELAARLRAKTLSPVPLERDNIDAEILKLTRLPQREKIARLKVYAEKEDGLSDLDRELVRQTALSLRRNECLYQAMATDPAFARLMLRYTDREKYPKKLLDAVEKPD